MAEVVIDITGRDNGAGGILGNLGSIITGIESAINLMSRAWDTAMGAITPFIASAADSEVTIAKLDAVLRATEGAAGLTSDELQDLANQLQGVTRYSDETILTGATLLLTFRNIGDETMLRAIPAMLDMAEMFGSVDASAMQLGKALNDPVGMMGALSRAGVTFNEEQKKLIKTLWESGDALGAQAIILTEVEKEVGDVAEAVGKTFVGQLAIAKNALDNIREVIGGPIITVLANLLSTFSEFAKQPEVVKFFEDAAASLEKFLLSLNLTDKLSGFADQVIVVFGRMFEAFHDGATIFDAISVGLKWIGGDDTPAWIVNLAKAVETAGDMFRNFFDTIRSGGTAMEAFGNALFAIGGDDTPQWLVNIGKAFKSGDWSTVVQSIVDSLTGAIDGANWSSFGQSVARILTGVIETVLKGLDVIVNRVDWGPFGEALLKAIGEVLSGMGSVIGKYVYWDSWVKFFKEQLPDAIIFGFSSGLLNGFGDVGFAIGTFISRVIAFFKNLLGISSPSTVFAAIGKDIVQGLINGILGMFPSLTSVVGGIFDLLTGGSLSGVMGNIFDSLTGGGGATGGASATTSFGSTGSIGGRSTADTGGTMTGGGNTFNFYGPIYVGSLQELVYDCVSPHPLLAATAGAIGGR